MLRYVVIPLASNLNDLDENLVVNFTCKRYKWKYRLIVPYVEFSWDSATSWMNKSETKCCTKTKNISTICSGIEQK